MKTKITSIFLILSVLLGVLINFCSDDSDSPNITTSSSTTTTTTEVKLIVTDASITTTKDNTPSMSWTNPVGNSSFDHVVIVRKEGSSPTDIGDGEIVYTGSSTSFIDTEFLDDGVYYYMIYACDSSGECSSEGVSLIFDKKMELSKEWEYVVGDNVANIEEGHLLKDDDGNIYVAGYTGYILSPVDFGGGTRDNNSIFILKLDKDGKYVWDYIISNVDDNNRIYNFKIMNDFIYLIGYSNIGVIDFGGGDRGASDKSINFILKIDKNGNYIKDTLIEYNDNYSIEEIDTDILDNIYIAGILLKSYDFGGGERKITNKSCKLFVLKSDSNKNYIWDYTTEDTTISSGLSYVYFKLNSNSELIITTQINKGVNLGQDDILGSLILLVLKLDSNGKYMWHYMVSTTEYPAGFGNPTFDSKGNIYIPGNFMGIINFGNGNITYKGKNDGFLAKLDSNGKFIWDYIIATEKDDYYFEIKDFDKKNNIYITSSYRYPTDFGGGLREVNSEGNREFYLLKLDENGKYLWDITKSTTKNEYGVDVLVDDDYNLYLTEYADKQLIISKNRMY